MENSRRDFLKAGALAGLGSLLIPQIAKAAVNNNIPASAPKLKLKENCVIMMQGDSITDAGRDKACNVANTFQQFGYGYTVFTAGQILATQAKYQPKIYNRGISGNKVFQLRERWEAECIAFQPDVLSILIGVNDFWHTLSSGYKGTIETYENDLRNLLKYTKEKLPNVQIVLGEPFCLKGGSAIDDRWFPEFDKYRKAAKKLSDEFKTIFVPYQSGFDEAMKIAPATYWSGDGVHPAIPGCQLMANMWIEATGLAKIN
jgi:lysophospholipase L1-like esterase